MSRRAIGLLVAVGALAAWVASAPPRPVVGQNRSEAAPSEQNDESDSHRSMRKIPCNVVISKIDKLERKERGLPADMSDVAKHLGTGVVWVEHCMLVYGRHPKRPGYESADSRASRLEAMEDDEPEESGPEDIEEPGAREREDIPDKPRVLRIKPPPTPDFYHGQD